MSILKTPGSRQFLQISGLLVAINSFAGPIPIDATNENFVVVSTKAEPVASGKFQPTWDSLKQYQCPEWFRDAKFGIWAHWGPQCQPEDGDWYARGMYQPGRPRYQFHTNHYGSPAVFGFKDVIHEWKAQNWDPDKLVALYKRAGAQYFFALANHHDNFDNWDSKYQPWNSVAVGPKKDLIGGWAAAARKYGLRFGVSVHAAHAWTWYEPAQAFDGNLTKADGKGKWWDGLDPQDLYAQNHPHSKEWNNPNMIHSQWNWGNGASLPDQAYCDKFYNRTVDLINKYHPDLIYFDDTALPLWPISDAGLKIAADFYNRNNQWHGTNDDGVLFGKILTPDQQKCMVWDIERGQANEIEPFPWQTDTCIGNWHYERSLYDRNGYKSAKMVIQMLADIVSKNGNLLLNIPVRGDGTIDDKELKVVEGIADWMDVNKECIFGTRPWKVFGEGPASAGAKLTAQGFNEGKGKPLTSEDVRFTRSKDGKTLYAIVLGVPTNGVSIKSLGKSAGLLDREIKKIELLGSGERLGWKEGQDALTISQPKNLPNQFAIVFKLALGEKPSRNSSTGPSYWQWAATPPMGWNSYDAWGTSVDEKEVLANTRYMREHLLAHGWKYIVIDARWYDSVSSFDDRDFNRDRANAKLFADEFGRMLPATNRFPSAMDGKGFKPLADQIHALGLKFGFHMMRGIPQQTVKAATPIEGSNFTAADAGDTNNKCGWCPDMFGVRNNEAGQAWYDSCARLWASWGIDFIKVDDISRPYRAHEIEMIRKAIDKCGRPIVFSTSPGPTDPKDAAHISRQANMWRISGDFWDQWGESHRSGLSHQFDLLAQWQGVGGPGHWPDADMIPFGHIGIKCTIAGPDRQTRFTRDEQRTLMSLWAIAPSPLMLGNNLPDTDGWTLSLLTNDEVLAVNQDPLGSPARRVAQTDGAEVWVKALQDGSKAVGLFNRGDAERQVELNWTDAGLTGKQKLRDLWLRKDVGMREGRYAVRVPAHGVVLLRVSDGGGN